MGYAKDDLFEMGLAFYFSYSESFQTEFGNDFFWQPV
jgi:hypothetical protein